MPRSSQSPQAAARRWSWTQFAFAAVIGAFIAFLSIDPLLDGFWHHLAKTLAVGGACGYIAGRFGDVAWHAIVKLLSWF
jgi:hypothetical protein